MKGEMKVEDFEEKPQSFVKRMQIAALIVFLTAVVSCVFFWTSIAGQLELKKQKINLYSSEIDAISSYIHSISN